MNCEQQIYYATHNGADNKKMSLITRHDSSIKKQIKRKTVQSNQKVESKQIMFCAYFLFVKVNY